jgi:hypothetical protein
MKTRINISIGAKIHAAAKKYAAARDMDFSELLAYLLRREMESPSVSPIGDGPKAKPAVVAQESATGARTDRQRTDSTSALLLNDPAPAPEPRPGVRYEKPAKKKP